MGEILASGTNAITIDAGPTDAVVLRGLILDGLGSTGGQGIVASTVGALAVEDCEIRNFGGNGFLDAYAGSASSRSNTQHNVTITNTTVRNSGGVGVSIGTLANPANVPLIAMLAQVNISGNLAGGFLLVTREQAILAPSPGGGVVPKAFNYNARRSPTRGTLPTA